MDEPVNIDADPEEALKVLLSAPPYPEMAEERNEPDEEPEAG